MRKYCCLVMLLALGACDAPKSESRAEVQETAETPPAVVKTTILEPAAAAQDIEGVATVLNPDTLVQLNADIRSAEIAANFSKRELERYRKTTSLSLHTVENAERQAGTDATQVALLALRLRQTWGDDAPMLDAEHRQQLVDELSSGKKSLVRLDFPHPPDGLPLNVRVLPLGGGGETPVTTLWNAPSGNSSMPGTSYFGLIAAGPGLRSLDRARLKAENGGARAGVVIPDSAIVIFAGETWCYVETEPQKFERKPVPLSYPVARGYLVESGFSPGTKVVVRGASTLLAREAEPEDDDDDRKAPAKDQKPVGPATAAAPVSPNGKPAEAD